MNNTFKLRLFYTFITLIVLATVLMLLAIVGGFEVAGEFILWTSVVISFLFMATAVYLSAR